MLTRIRHHFGLALPLFAVGFFSLLGFFVVRTVMDVTTAQPVTAMEYTLGEGIDVASQYLAVLGGFLPQITSQTGILTTIAMIATALSLLAVLVYLFKVIRGFGDIHRFFSHAATRISPIAWGNRHPVWGTVNDSETGASLAFAHVHLLDSRRAVLATTVTNARGEYRFRLAPASVAGHTLQAQKNGYYFPSRKSTPHTLNILMDAASRTTHSSISRVSAMLNRTGTIAFWTSMVSVPLAIAVGSTPIAPALAIGFAASLIGRIATR